MKTIYKLTFNNQVEYQANLQAAKQRAKHLESKGLTVMIGIETVTSKDTYAKIK